MSINYVRKYVPFNYFSSTSNMENTEKVRELAESLRNSVKELSSAMQPMLGKSMDELLKECHLPKEEADFLNNYLYCTVSVIFAYLKAQGINTDGHPIMKELDRVKASMKKLKELDAKKEKAEKDDIKNKEQAASYIQNTLGGQGAAVPDRSQSPAISAVHFQGKHTKFDNEDSDSEHELQQNEKKEAPKKPLETPIQEKPGSLAKRNTGTAPQHKKSDGRVTKPKHNAKGFNKNKRQNRK